MLLLLLALLLLLQPLSALTQQVRWWCLAPASLL
jgi:hypothetical protein